MMLQLKGTTVSLSGAVTAKTYGRLREAAASVIGTANLQIDWSAVTEVDSSAVALILSWQRDAIRQRVTIESSKLPESLVALIDLYSLTPLVSVTVPRDARQSESCP